MLNKETCSVHEAEVSKIDIVMTDVKWLKRFGSWWMAITGAAIVLFLPLIITFAVYVHSIDKRLATIEQLVKDHIQNTVPQTIKKVPDSN